MVTHQAPLDLFSDDNVILLNPRLPKEDFAKLQTLAETAQQERGLQGHVWIATSGSTASSAAAIKLVALSKTALIASAQSVNQYLQSTAQDTWAQVLPHFHVGGLGIEIRAQLAGAKVIKALQDGKWDVEHFFRTVAHGKCTLGALVPTQVYDLVVGGYKCPSTMRAIVVGGGAFDGTLYEQARSLGWPVLPSYGMTETASQIATASLNSLQSEQYPEIELLSHAEARTDAEGFIEVRAKSLFTCYAQNTDQGIRHWDPKEDGWFKSEDRGEVIGRTLKISGRTKDYIKIGGEGSNVASLRLQMEAAAMDMNPLWPMQATMLDMPSDRLGSEIHMVTTLGQADAEALAETYGKRVMPYEKIRMIHYVDEIPRTDLGKIMWSALRGKL